MLRQALLGLAVLLAGAAAPAFGQEVKLQLKFKEGEKFWMEEVSTSKIDVSVGGVPVDKSEQKTTQISSYTVKKVTPASIVMEMKIEDVGVGAGAGVAGTLGGILEKTKGAVFTVTLAPDGKVKKIEGLPELLKKFGDGDDAKLIKEQLNEEMLTKGIEQTFAFVPAKAVKKGDTWTRDTVYPLGSLGNLMSKNTYTYNGKVEAGEEIGVKYAMEYKAPKEAALGGLLKIVKGDLKGDRAKGTFIFSPEKGRLVSAKTSMHIHGTLMVESAGQQLPMELSVEESTVSRVHDKNPVKN